jgi:hypothetical protein
MNNEMKQRCLDLHTMPIREGETMLDRIEEAMRIGAATTSEAVAWRITRPDDNEPVFLTDNNDDLLLADRFGWQVEPLYLAAQPINQASEPPMSAPKGWTFHAPFRAWKPDESDLHAPWFVVVPTSVRQVGDSNLEKDGSLTTLGPDSPHVGKGSGPTLSISFHADDAYDKAMAEWIAEACNRMMRATPSGEQSDTAPVRGEAVAEIIEQFFCTKCGYSGAIELHPNGTQHGHERPDSGGKECGYTAFGPHPITHFVDGKVPPVGTKLYAAPTASGDAEQVVLERLEYHMPVRDYSTDTGRRILERLTELRRAVIDAARGEL